MKIEIYDSGGEEIEVGDSPPKTIRIKTIGFPLKTQEYELQYYMKFNKLTNKAESKTPYYVLKKGD